MTLTATQKGAQMTAPYYEDALVTLYNADSLTAIEAMDERSFDAVVTDPPYDERTHTLARSSNTNLPAGMRSLAGTRRAFASFTPEAHRDLFIKLGVISRRWVISSLPTSTAFRFDLDPPTGLRVMRISVWVKTNPMPIISADRPALGWEPIVCLHRDDVKPFWNGGGRAMNHVGPTSQGSGHPTQKPLGMVQEWVRQFTNPGDAILDPFAGTGTTLRAAADEGRRAVGYEIDERYCELAATRLAQQSWDLEGIA